MCRFTVFVAVSSLFMATHATADSLQQCRTLTDANTRLLCYDQLADAEARPHSTVAVTQPATAAQQTVTTAVAVAPPQAGGPTVAATPPARNRDEALFGTSGETIESAFADLTVTVLTVTKDARQRLVLGMSNEQRWQQLDNAYFKVSTGDSCVISSAIFGSFTLKCPQGNKSIKVKRVR